MSVYNFANSVVAGAAGQSTGFYPKTIEGSLRFNSGDQPYISYTNGTATDGKQCTLSFWIKKNEIIGSTTTARFISAYSGVGNQFHSQWGDGTTSPGDQWNVSPGEQSSQQGFRMTTASLRDPSAWYHCVWSYNSTSGSESVVLYVNGVAQTSSYTDAPTSNLVTSLTKSGTEVKIGYINSSMPDFQLAELFIIDGTAHDADAFGETKNGVWVPKNITASDFIMGNNGVYLNFQDDTEVEAFNTVLWRGNGGTQSITGFGFAPDLVWTKWRNGTGSHQLYDTVRGATNRLRVDRGDLAEDVKTNGLISFDSDGFTVGDQTGVNASGDQVVAWGWKAGGNSDTYNINGTGYATASAAGLDGGTTTPTGASISTTYGFAIIAYTGASSTSTEINHGLGSAPAMIIIKSRDEGTTDYTGQWDVYHKDARLDSDQGYLVLNSTAGQEDGATNVFNAEPTSSSFFIGNAGAVNQSPDNYIAYCWAEKAGYSSFGSYSGGTDGTSVTGLGFKPALVIVKPSSGGTGGWRIYDNTRDVTNPTTKVLIADNSNAEADSSNSIDIDADGFTLNGTSTAHNGSGYTYIYAAFADTREAAFWLDQSGNDNDWQPVNLDHNDTVADSPTDNFATLNPLELNYVTLSDGNLVVQESSGSWRSIRANFMMTSGQWYWEFEGTASASDYFGGGISKLSEPLTSYVGNSANGYGILAFNGNKYNSSTATSFTSAFTVGDVIGVAFDADAGTLEYYKNGTSIGTPFTGLTSGDFFPAFSVRSSTVKVNFGQQPFKHDPPA